MYLVHRQRDLPHFVEKEVLFLVLSSFFEILILYNLIEVFIHTSFGHLHLLYKETDIFPLTIHQIKSLTLGILFPTVVKAAVLANLVILGISFLISFVLTLRVVLVAKLVISGILSLIFLILVIFGYTSFLRTSFFTASLHKYQLLLHFLNLLLLHNQILKFNFYICS